MKHWVSMIALACFVFPTAMTRADSGKMDTRVLGPWKLQLTLPDGEQQEQIVLLGRQYDEYRAWRVGKTGLEPFLNVKLDEDVLTGNIKPKDAPGITVTLKAQLDGESRCKGTGRYHSEDGDSGEFSFSGERINPASLDDVSQWKLQFVSPDDETHKATLTVIEHGDKLHAWYSGKDHDIPVSEITVDGNRVTMKVTAVTRDGSKVNVTFRGTVDDQTVTGTVEYQLDGESGTFSFSGKRVS